MKLILFFNGWGMDENIISHLDIPSGYTLKTINFPYDINSAIFQQYNEVIPVGWSFGSYYLAKYLTENNIKCKKVISLNGSPEMIGKNGISEGVFNLTLDTLTPDTLLKFYGNMGIDDTFSPSKKNFQDIKDELQYFKDHYVPQKNVFTHAFIGKKDKIIPVSRQKKYFETNETAFTEITCGHYPFSAIKSWDILIGE
ncbi:MULTISPECIES: pimeloyl-ACP methyl esterase BioG family protein [Fusobacterium]|uniref:pimeloyl-ACP methyl esterase BioG family protein n=1 Tax=Fusobacterium TaxID=848 RepID=UPI001032FA33|nr:pimeloyl-ACP methyl esterase BioG family protein [Fusobacterium ulcerans]